MSDPGRDRTPAYAEAKQRRLELQQTLVKLEQEIASPARGRVADWAANVSKALLMLAGAFDEHITATERPGGLYEEILENSPRFDGPVRRLRDEHPVIRDSIQTELGRLGEAIEDGDPLDDLRDDLQRVMGLVVRHRQRGADLVWEAYNLDIGGAE